MSDADPYACSITDIVSALRRAHENADKIADPNQLDCLRAIRLAIRRYDPMKLHGLPMIGNEGGRMYQWLDEIPPDKLFEYARYNHLPPSRGGVLLPEPTHYIHYNGAASFVKEAKFFESQGGLTQEWGKAWRPVVAASLEDAKGQCDKLAKGGPAAWFGDRFLFPHNLSIPELEKLDVLHQALTIYCAYLNQLRVRNDFRGWALKADELYKVEDFAPGDPAAGGGVWTYVSQSLHTHEGEAYFISASDGEDKVLLIAITSGASPEKVDHLVQIFDGNLTVVATRGKDGNLELLTRATRH